MYELYESDFNAPVKLWLPLEEVEPGALDQLRNAARHPEVTPRVAVMPDCHIGYGVTIGCVLPTSESVIPNAVGVDIGCGMCALDTGVAYDPAPEGPVVLARLGGPGGARCAQWVQITRAAAGLG